MLPEVRDSFTDAFSAEEFAAHIGAERAVLDDVDPGSAWPKNKIPGAGRSRPPGQ